jgi:hypothetical protein
MIFHRKSIIIMMIVLFLFSLSRALKEGAGVL